jgi:hypothetical protein
MTTRLRLAQLGALAGMMRDRDLGALAKAANDAAALAAKIDGLAAEVAARSAQLSRLPNEDAAWTAGADAKWLGHLDRHRATLKRDLVQALARREAALRVASRSLGRADVLDHLSRK